MNNSTYSSLMKQKGFSAFLVTQFLSALNDNLLKWVVTFLVMGGLVTGGSGSQGVDLERISLAFILPSLLFTGVAGFLADNFNKRKVLIITKAFEIGVMGLAWLALKAGDFNLQLGVLFLLCLQFTFFGPAKYGVVPELVRDEDMSRANGLLEMSTFLAILLGSVLAGPLFTAFKDQLDVIALVLMAMAVLGSLTSLGIGQVPDPATRQPFKLSLFWSEVVEGTRTLRKDRRLWLTTLGIAYFWFQGALFQQGMVLLGTQVMGLDENGITHLGMALAIGIGIGSMVAGRWSGDKVELGLVPLGSLGMGVGSLVMAWSATKHPGLVVWSLGFVGFSAGLFAVPLNALLQQKAEAGAKGRLQAASNFISTLALITSAFTVGWLNGRLGLRPDHLLMLAGLGCFAMTAYLFILLPEFVLRFILWLATHTVYKIRIEGAVNVPHKGGALLVCNHTALSDGLLVQACIQRFVRFMVHRSVYDAKALHWMFKAGNAICVSAKPGDAQAAVDTARAQIQAGHVVCIFAEGGITRTGNILKFKKGLERIMDGVDAPIIPVHLDGLWGSLFSFRLGSFKWKLPERFPYPVTVTFGAPMPSNSTAVKVRHKVQELGAEALGLRLDRNGRLNDRFVRNAKRHFFAQAMVDSTGANLSYGKALAASLSLAGWMKKNVPEPLVGVLLPASAAGALVNVAATLAGKATVNLNFTAGADFMADAQRQCDLKTVITSKAFLEKTGMSPLPGSVYMEDLAKGSFKLRTILWMAFCLITPSVLLQWILKVRGGKPGDLATIIFSSGSTGVPKGVMLSHKNIQANLEGLAQVLQVRPEDRLLAALPLFHSLGYTGAVWFPLGCGFSAIYHPNPLDAGVLGKLAKQHGATLLFSTPTFCQGYIRKCQPEQFASLRYAIVGAEKLREAVATAFKDKFGVELLEGYGCTEMSPLVSVNVPNVISWGEQQLGQKAGTVGAPIPGVTAKVVDLETGVDLAPGQSGLLLVKGPNRMDGYWQRPDLTAAATQDDWYITGDVATIDADGFIQLTDRLSRFSKIGGEMVPHMKIEEQLLPLLAEATACVVCSVPDEARGERLVLLHTDLSLSAERAAQALAASGMPKLWLPKQDSIFYFESIPSLGTGKTDLRRCKELALTLTGGLLKQA